MDVQVVTISHQLSILNHSKGYRHEPMATSGDGAAAHWYRRAGSVRGGRVRGLRPLHHVVPGGDRHHGRDARDPRRRGVIATTAPPGLSLSPGPAESVE